VANVDYPANQWWHYSEGLKDVVTEFAAYLVFPVSVLPLISGATSSARSSRFERPVSPEPEKLIRSLGLQDLTCLSTIL
jgi:hypothetical protein